MSNIVKILQNLTPSKPKQVRLKMLDAQWISNEVPVQSEAYAAQPANNGPTNNVEGPFEGQNFNMTSPGEPACLAITK